VAVDAENQGNLRQYLADLGRDLGLDEPVPLPELNADDLTFLGGRTLVINGMSVAQLGYRDARGRLLAICFMRNPTGESKAKTVDQIGDLRMADWRDAKFQYVVVGYLHPNELEDLADRLQRSYEL
jgi:anti-sigma factor RsiW